MTTSRSAAIRRGLEGKFIFEIKSIEIAIRNIADRIDDLGELGEQIGARYSHDDGHRFPPGPGAQWDGPQPAIRRGDDGIPRRVDRLRCLGNAVVPAQAALAWRTLTARVAALEAA